jgi:hypothetical protein
MKNIHVLKTDKSSNIVISTIDGKLKLNNNTNDSVEYSGRNQNIYITSDEEIKEGDWCLLNNRLVVRYFKPPVESKSFKKITLTTDQDLIKDGVQAIDDEFLEWFVKNPSCEKVEVVKGFADGTAWGYNFLDYRIIIPKEEAKKKHIVMLVGDKVNDEQTKCYCGHTTYCDCGPKELELTQLEPLEVPMPIQNESISSWNKSNTSPKFDGEYLCYISCREECGNVHRYYKVVSNSFNIWLINENERVALWKKLPKNPFND